MPVISMCPANSSRYDSRITFDEYADAQLPLIPDSNEGSVSEMPLEWTFYDPGFHQCKLWVPRLDPSKEKSEPDYVLPSVSQDLYSSDEEEELLPLIWEQTFYKCLQGVGSSFDNWQEQEDTLVCLSPASMFPKSSKFRSTPRKYCLYKQIRAMMDVYSNVIRLDRQEMMTKSEFVSYLVRVLNAGGELDKVADIFGSFVLNCMVEDISLFHKPVAPLVVEIASFAQRLHVSGVPVHRHLASLGDGLHISLLILFSFLNPEQFRDLVFDLDFQLDDNLLEVLSIVALPIPCGLLLSFGFPKSQCIDSLRGHEHDEYFPRTDAQIETCIGEMDAYLNELKTSVRAICKENLRWHGVEAQGGLIDLLLSYIFA